MFTHCNNISYCIRLTYWLKKYCYTMALAIYCYALCRCHIGILTRILNLPRQMVYMASLICCHTLYIKRIFTFLYAQKKYSQNYVQNNNIEILRVWNFSYILWTTDFFGQLYTSVLSRQAIMWNRILKVYKLRELTCAKESLYKTSFSQSTLWYCIDL